jgi:RND family efflux transporter MFP subunit
MKKALSSFVAATAAGWLGSGCSTPQASETKAAQPVRTQVVAVAPPQLGVRYSASIEPLEQVQLAFKATGYVDDLLRRQGADGRTRAAQAGDRVERGTVLARVRETDYRERVNQGRAGLAKGEAGLIKARLDLERARTLFAADSLTKPDLDAAQAAFDSAEAQVSAARADLELALGALRDCELVAPANGIILERRVEIGTLAGAGTVGFLLGDVTSVKARFGIPDSMVRSVKLGDAVSITVEAVAATAFAGRVTTVAPAADQQSRVFQVEITIPNQDGRLRPGMIGTVSVGQPAVNLSASAHGPLTVPLTAIVRSEAGAGSFAVLVVERQDATDVARLRRVELGEVIGNGITVLKGVNLGERVIVSGATLVVDGDPVRASSATND